MAQWCKIKIAAKIENNFYNLCFFSVIEIFYLINNNEKLPTKKLKKNLNKKKVKIK